MGLPLCAHVQTHLDTWLLTSQLWDCLDLEPLSYLWYRCGEPHPEHQDMHKGEERAID